MDREFCQPKRGKQAPEFGQAVPENSRIVWVLKRPLKVVCTAPCNEQGHLALDHLLRALSNLISNISPQDQPPGQ